MRKRVFSNEYAEIWEVDQKSEWMNGAYTEDGDDVQCEWCGGRVMWDPETRGYKCRECLTEFSRAQHFIFIGAEPPGPACMSICRENYPFCKRYCELYEIDETDPML
mgnify:FL=1